MGLLATIKRRFSTEQRASVPAAFSPYLHSVTGIFGPATDAGVDVTPLRAMQCSAVWACIRTIAETIASLPFHVFKETDGVKVRDREHALYPIIHDRPNEYMASFTLRDQLLTQLLLHGNGYGIIQRDPATQRPTAILPLESPTVTVYRHQGNLFYVTAEGDIILPGDMIHLIGYTLNGIVGISPIMQQKAAIGLAVAEEQFGSAFFKNGGHLSGLFERSGALSPEAAKSFKEEWAKFYQGLANAHGTPLLPQGVTYKALTVPPDSAQFLESRKYQRGDIAAIFRCPPFVVGDHEHSTFSNLESQGRQLLMFTLAPWIQRIEAEFSRKLFREDEQGTYSVKLNVDGLQRGDMTARMQFYSTGRQWGILSADDCRALEDLPPLPDGIGRIYMMPVNMAPAGTTPTPAPQPAQRELPDARPILEDAARRLLVKESKALTRAAKKCAGKPAELRQWAEQWYQTHETLVAKVMTPALRAAGIDNAADYAKRHVADSIRAITTIIEAGADAQDVADELVDIRPAEIVDSLLKKEG
jgi:HK97 family phage portal protein